MSLGSASISEAPIASGGGGDPFARIAGIPANTSVGSVSISAGAGVPVTSPGLLTSSLGSVSFRGDVAIGINGFGTVASLGIAKGSGNIEFSVNNTNLGLTASQGDEDVIISVSIVPSSFNISGSVGNPVVPAAALPTGSQAVLSVGDSSIIGDANTSVTGLEATIQSIPNVTIEGNAIVYPENVLDDLLLQTDVITPTIIGDANVEVSGFDLGLTLSTATVWGRIIPDANVTWNELGTI